MKNVHTVPPREIGYYDFNVPGTADVLTTFDGGLEAEVETGLPRL